MHSDPQRQLDRIGGVQSRVRADQEQARRRLEDLTIGLKKARRSEELAFADWRAKPTPATFAEVEACMRGVALLRAQLAEASR